MNARRTTWLILPGAVLLLGVLAEPALAEGSGELAGGAASAATGSFWETALFFIIGGTAALTALGCVISTNIVRMATCLFGTLGSVALLYFMLGAHFLGAIQLIVYAGGTLIVIIFGVMLTSKSPWIHFEPRRAELIVGGVLFLVLFAGLSMVLSQTVWPPPPDAQPGFDVAGIGWALLNTYLVPFELASVLLLAVMIGAAYLARPERGD